MRFIGDVHGLVPLYRATIENCPRSIQVGDFGIGIDGVEFPKGLGPEHRFIRGNHDNPELCATESHWIPDGTVEGSTMVVGGAWSFEHGSRTPGKNWWPNEELSGQELEVVIERYTDTKPRVMVTHDCPERLLQDIFHKEDVIGTATGYAFDEMLRQHRPELWIFGHHHRSVDRTIEGTRFICLDEGDFVDVDLETLKVLHFGRWSWPKDEPWIRKAMRLVGL